MKRIPLLGIPEFERQNLDVCLHSFFLVTEYFLHTMHRKRIFNKGPIIKNNWIFRCAELRMLTPGVHCMFLRFEVFTVGEYVCCEDGCLLIALMMEAARTSKTLVNFYQTTRRYKPEDSQLRAHRRENLKSYLCLLWSCGLWLTLFNRENCGDTFLWNGDIRLQDKRRHNQYITPFYVKEYSELVVTTRYRPVEHI
jgi:hypothetical protein